MSCCTVWEPRRCLRPALPFRQYCEVHVSAHEGSKFQEAVENEKLYGAKRPRRSERELDTMVDVVRAGSRPTHPCPPTPKYHLGQWLVFETTAIITSGVRLELMPGSADKWQVYYRLRNKWVEESKIERRLVEG